MSERMLWSSSCTQMNLQSNQFALLLADINREFGHLYVKGSTASVVNKFYFGSYPDLECYSVCFKTEKRLSDGLRTKLGDMLSEFARRHKVKVRYQLAHC